MNPDKYIISYDFGYSDWYVSEFYKYFHLRLIQDNPNLTFEYLPLTELSKKFNVEYNSNILFNWFNLILYNPKTEKFFIHSWNDNAPMILEQCAEYGINLRSFSCVTNLKNDDIIEKWKDEVKINPSVYCLSNWSDHLSIRKASEKVDRKDKAFFNGLLHSHRRYVKEIFEEIPFFEIKSREQNNKIGYEYFDEVSDYKFGLSLNGAAHICYRDIELFGLRVLNLRETLHSKTYNPIIKNVHYLDFIDDSFYIEILNQTENAHILLQQKMEQLHEFLSTGNYTYMINEANTWFTQNILPENQYKIISSFLEDFTIFN
jgi:hypothetical protein